MVRMRWAILGLIGAAALPVLSSGQSVAPAAPISTPDVQMTGSAATDFVTLRAMGPSVPLRFGGIVVGSEKVMLDGTPLSSGADYSMDYATGVVYLMRAQRAGQTLVVNYRYDSTRTSVPANPFNGLAGFHFDLAPGSLGMMMGLGMAERTADGQVLTSNVIGMNNAFSFGGGLGLKGLFLVGDKQKESMQSTADMPTTGAQAPTVDSGHSQLLLESLQSKISGGTLKLDYQDVGSTFTGFSQAVAAGYDQKVVDKLTKEKGLKRMGFALDGAKVGSLSLTDGFHTVGDSSGNISWRNFGLKQGGLSLDWQSRDVDKTFTRFADIAEADRAQLQSEAGILRNSMNGSYAMKFGTLGFTSSKIQDDDTGQSIQKQVYTLNTKNIKFNLGDQQVDSGFTRFNSLFDADKAQWGREAGLSRQWMGLEASLTKNTSLKFSQSLVHSSTGDLLSRDMSYVGKTWSLQHEEHNVDKGFGALGNMPGADIDVSVKSIAQMYGNPNATFSPDDRNQFLAAPGIDRNYTRLQFEPYTKVKLTMDSLSLKGISDGAHVQSLNLEGQNLTLKYRKETVGANFSEITSLMNVERASLGALVGINRTDLGFSMNMKDGKKLAFNTLKVDSAQGGAERSAAEFVTKKLDIAVSTRSVDAGFANATQLVDPENAMLATLAGFKESEAKVKWQLLPNMKIDAFFSTAGGADLKQAKLIRNFAASWAPDKKTGFDYQHLEQHSDDPMSVLFANVFDQMTFSRDLGKIGKLKYVDLRQEYDGLQATLPSFTQHLLSFETNLDKKTTLSTQQSMTRYDNGDKEDVSTNTISTTLSKSTGVSVTDSAVDRDGTDRDERKRNYGFWYDFGKGLKVAYGYNRQLAGGQMGALQSTLSVTPGTVGDVKLDGASYNVNEWDDTRTQATSNVSFSTAKPLRFGRITDFKFNFGMDTAADYSNWLRENRLITASGKYASNTIGYLYKGQMDATGARGIDRGFTFATDQSPDKKYVFNIGYKLRTLPMDQQYMIRDYSLKVRPARNFELTNTLATNPEVVVPTAILGSVTQNVRANKWKLDYKRNSNMTVGGSFDEEYANGALSRTGGITLAFNAAKGSPISLFLGGETTDQGGARHSLTRYQLRYDQKPGANQQFSLFAGNVTYEHTVADTLNSSGVTLRLDYQFRF